MKKRLLILLFSGNAFLPVFSQQVTPLISTDQCPGVNITFTVTIAAQSIQSVTPKALNVNPIVVQQPFNITYSGGNATFNFVGKFVDYNNKQTFTVNYTNASGQLATYDIIYIKIKSLQTANPFSQIYPTPTSITAQRCQLQNFNISFPNVQYGNPWEAPPVAYGTITNYEYLLPAGWKLGTQTSNGSAWLPAGNNVTVTSDLSHGSGTSIRIRPSNIACASGLVAGQEAYVSISRPTPTLTISSTQDAICSGCASYTINGMTSGATVNWTLSSSTNAYISGCTNCATVTVCRSTSVSAVVTLTATVTDCIQTYPAVTKSISLGAPTALTGIDEEKTNNGCVTETSVYTAIGGTGATNYKWYYRKLPSSLFTLRQNGTSNTYTLVQSNKGASCTDYEIKLEAINSCISTPYVNTIQSEVCPCNFLSAPTSLNYRVSPNPAKNTIAVSVMANASLNNADNSFDAINIYDFTGSLKISKKYSKAKTSSIDIARLQVGTYYIEITSAGIKERQQLIIQK